MFPLGSSGGVKVTLTLFTSSGIADTITFLGGSLGSRDTVEMILEKIIDYLVTSTVQRVGGSFAEIYTYPPQAFETQ